MTSIHPIALAVRLFGVAIAFSSLTSCATKVPVPQSFWQEKKARIAVAVAIPRSEGDCFKAGNQGLLDIVINNAMASGPEKAISQLKPDQFRKVKGEFIAALKKKGLNAVEVKEDLQLGNYPKLGDGSSRDSGKDFSSLMAAKNVDYLIVLKLDGYGSIRQYYGFLPISAPSGYAITSGFMVKKDAQKPVWDTGGALPSSVSVSGNWDEGPEFKNLVNAAASAIEFSRGSLSGEFFK